jgi:hypothetical protein
MAQDKKSFVLYADLIHTVKKMSREDAGELLLHILKYVNDENPETDNMIVDLTFEPIKQQFKRDLKKWEITLEKRSDAGKASAEARRVSKLNQQNSTNLTHVESVQQTSTNPTVNVTVNDTVTVTDTVIKKKLDIVARKLKFSSTLQPFLEIYGKDFLNDFYKYWTEPNKSNSKFKQELERTWDLERRLGTWAKNDKNFNKSENGSKTIFGSNTANKKTYEFSVDRVIKTYAGDS